ncbi:MAG TPA: acyl carrier protein [Ramlibacter sp.]|jgi:acyl carrier protein
MTDSVLAGVQQIFREQLRDASIELRPDMQTGSLDRWDSFANVEILLACEERWGFRFKAAEIDGLRSVGDLVRAIEAKIA